jgi:hypothetical protein
VAWFLRVKDLKVLLNKYDEDAVIMVGVDRDSGEAYEADPDLVYCYRTPDGEMLDEFSVEKDESLLGYRRALIIWGVDK